MLARALPSVHYVFLTTGGFLSSWGGFHERPYVEREGKEEEPESGWKPYERWHVGRGWRIAQSGTSDGDGVAEEERSLVELHDDVVETIIRNEELILSKYDEVSIFSYHTRETRLKTVFRRAGGAPLELWLGQHCASFVRGGCSQEDAEWGICVTSVV